MDLCKSVLSLWRRISERTVRQAIGGRKISTRLKIARVAILHANSLFSRAIHAIPIQYPQDELNKYRETGYIKSPVRAWESCEDAAKYSAQTGRRLIIRLKLPEDSVIEYRNNGNAIISDKNYYDEELLGCK